MAIDWNQLTIQEEKQIQILNGTGRDIKWTSQVNVKSNVEIPFKLDPTKSKFSGNESPYVIIKSGQIKQAQEYDVTIAFVVADEAVDNPESEKKTLKVRCVP